MNQHVIHLELASLRHYLLVIPIQLLYQLLITGNCLLVLFIQLFLILFTVLALKPRLIPPEVSLPIVHE